jgi:hypothetical protein
MRNRGRDLAPTARGRTACTTSPTVNALLIDSKRYQELYEQDW